MYSIFVVSCFTDLFFLIYGFIDTIWHMALHSVTYHRGSRRVKQTPKLAAAAVVVVAVL